MYGNVGILRMLEIQQESRHWSLLRNIPEKGLHENETEAAAMVLPGGGGSHGDRRQATGHAEAG